MNNNSTCERQTADSPHHHLQKQNDREARNLAEKQRRDKLNASINELSKMVPHSSSTRRLDKTAVLRFAAHGLRLQYCFGNSLQNTKIFNEKQQILLQDSLMQLLDSFFLTLTCHGNIILISKSVENLLGYCQSDLYGQNILNVMTHPDDQQMMRQQLIPKDLEIWFEQRRRAASFEPSSEKYNVMSDIDNRLLSDHRSFTVRLAKAGTRSDCAPRSYEIVRIDGCFRRSDSWIQHEDDEGNSYPIVSQLIRRSRNNSNLHAAKLLSSTFVQHDLISQAAMHGISGNDIVFVAIARLIRPPKFVRHLSNSSILEYKTRHLIDGRIVDCDQRIGLVAGYMKEEVKMPSILLMLKNHIFFCYYINAISSIFRFAI